MEANACEQKRRRVQSLINGDNIHSSKIFGFEVMIPIFYFFISLMNINVLCINNTIRCILMKIKGNLV
jgi:hypothetical protein